MVFMSLTAAHQVFHLNPEKLEGEIGPRLIHMVHNIQDALSETP